MEVGELIKALQNFEAHEQIRMELRYSDQKDIAYPHLVQRDNHPDYPKTGVLIIAGPKLA